jgi:hypothetical protein
LAKFATFLMQGNTDVLADASRLAMQAPQINTEWSGDMLHYGYGLLIQQGIYLGANFYDIKIVMHDGAMPGYSSSVYTVPELGFGFIALSNTDYAQVFNAFVTALSLYAPLPQPTTGPDNSNDPAEYPRYWEPTWTPSAVRIDRPKQWGPPYRIRGSGSRPCSSDKPSHLGRKRLRQAQLPHGKPAHHVHFRRAGRGRLYL